MKITNTTSFATKLALLSMLVLFANTSNSNANSIGIVDVEDIIKNASVMKDIKKKVEAKQSDFQKEIDKKQSALEAESKKIESKKSSLNEAAYTKEQEKFSKKIDELKEFVEKKQNSLRKASLDSMSKVNEEMKDIIAEISKEKGLDLVIPASNTLYSKDGMNISSEVLKRLNKNLSKVDVSFE
jgi:Skp family chaperone for outer membrane proteins